MRVSDLQTLLKLFDEVGAAYRSDNFDLNLFPPIISECYAILAGTASPSHYAKITRRGSEQKSYWVFVDNADESNLSRPYRETLFIDDFDEWSQGWAQMISSIDRNARTMNDTNTQRILYSASMAFFAVIDLSVKRGSRKTNGTFLEWLLGTLLVCVTGFQLTRHIPISIAADDDDDGDNEGSVPTDIVLNPGDGRYNLVFPVKISTRERIGQIFTHQRILDTEFPGKYRSSLLCVSETQLMKKNHSAQETCVPQQVSFNEKYIAHIDALYYLDPPFPYIDDAITVPVRRISDLFSTDISVMSRAVEEALAEDCGHTISTIDCNLPNGHEGDHLFLPLRGTPLESSKLTAKDVGD